MYQRTVRSEVAFERPFTIRGYPETFPAGTYEVVAEDELLQNLSFEAWRRSATHLVVRSGAGRTELRPVEQNDLEDALSRDRAAAHATVEKRGAAHLPPEDMK